MSDRGLLWGNLLAADRQIVCGLQCPVTGRLFTQVTTENQTYSWTWNKVIRGWLRPLLSRKEEFAHAQKNCPAAESILEMCEKYLVPRSMRKFDKQIQTAICYFPPASGSVAKVDRQARHGGEPCAVASVTLWSILCLLPCCMNANIYISQKEFEYVCWIWKVLMNWGWSTFRDGHLPWSGQHSIWYFMAKTNIIHKDLELRRMSQGKSRLQTVWKRGLQMVVWRQAKRGKRTLWKGLKGSSPGFTVFRHISTYFDPRTWQVLTGSDKPLKYSGFFYLAHKVLGAVVPLRWKWTDVS